jgi:capsular exopolysaccharide synthesis family protein
MDPASYPTEPSREQLWKFMLYALALAAGCAFATALGLERWREPVETESDVEGLALRLLGSVATFSRHGSVKPATNERAAASTNPNATSLAAVNIHQEMYRSICATIETVRTERPFRSILLTSPGPGEGKSTTSLNLAYAFQDFGRRVLVIEADLRRPVLASRLQLSMAGAPSLVQFLQGSATFEEVCRSLASGVAVIPSSTAPGNATILLASERMRTLLTEARERFDIILCDSAPVLAVPDNILLIKAFEAAIIVVKASTTSRRLLAKTARQLDLAGASIVGVVVNQANPRDVAYYHQRYRRYYRYAPVVTADSPVSGSRRRRR